jgi:hypothetical protein
MAIRGRGWGVVFCLLFVRPALTADPACPSYPKARRESDFTRLELERLASSYSAAHKSAARRRVASASANFIDDYIFGKMTADGVSPAPGASDAEFLRRVSIDLTGRIPTVEQAERFLSDDNPNKRSQLINALLGSEAFIDNFTLSYLNLFEVTSGYYNLIGIDGRNYFYRYIRDFIERDRSYREVTTELITAAGDAQASGPANFIVRGFQQGDPIQDTWDTLTDRVTTRFLGLKTECVSCHDGRRHLEQINLFLTSRRREEFWRMSAFFSRMNLVFVSVDAFNQQMRGLVTDRSVGGYHSVVSPNNPGPRPSRSGGPYEPAYVFTGEKPASGEWRPEFARMVTADRQFARAAVNYLWAHFFSVGIVDPPDGWDLARIDPKNPPPAPWTLQPTHPELIEALADEFIRGDYSIRRIIRLLAESNAYQLSSRYGDGWRSEYARYFAKHIPRRLSAEEVYDAVATATLTETPMFVEGFDQPLMYASQLPDPREPRGDGNIRNFLNNFGRGDWFQVPRNSTSTVLQVLYLMNDNVVNFRTFADRVESRNTQVAQLMQSALSDEAAVRRLFLATLSRYPSDDELATAMRNRRNPRDQWLTDIQWALLNKLDFLFNY